MSLSIRKNNSVVYVGQTIIPDLSENWTKSGNNIFNNNPGNVGINNTNPSFNLDVNGNTNLNGSLIVDGNLLTVDASNNRVGVNATSIGYTFDVSGNMRNNNGQLLFTNTNNPSTKESCIFISKETPYPDTIVAPNRIKFNNVVLIGGSVDISNGIQTVVDYSTIIHGSVAGEIPGITGDSSNNCIIGQAARMAVNGKSRGTAVGRNATLFDSDSVAVGYNSKTSRNGVTIGSESAPNLSLFGVNNTFIGKSVGAGIVNGQGNIAIGNSARFTGDVSNSLSINNQANSSVGGIYGINMGTNAFQLGINKNSPVTTLDVSGNIKTNPGTTTMTNGFVYVPGALGPNTSVPTTFAGSVPMYVDTFNQKFGVYIGGTWRYTSALLP